MSDEQRNQAPGFDITGMAKRLADEWLEDMEADFEKIRDARGEPSDVLAPKLRDPIIAKCLLDPGNRHVNLEDAARNTLQVLQSTKDHAATVEDAVRNLLAVIHRDGGHHTAKVGIIQSCKDAENAWHNRTDT